MARREGHTGGPPRRERVEVEALEAQRVHYRREVAQARVEGEVVDVAIREPEAATVVARHPVVARVPGQEARLVVERAAHALGEVGAPAQHEDQRRTGTAGGVGDAHAVGGSAKAICCSTESPASRGTFSASQVSSGAR